MLKKLSKREKILIIVLVVLASFLIILNLIYTPIKARFDDLNSQIQMLTDSKFTIDLKLSEYEGTKDKIDDAKKQNDELKNYYGDYVSKEEASIDLYYILDNIGLSLKQLEVSIVEDVDVKTYKFNITANKDLNLLEDLISAIDESSYMKNSFIRFEDEKMYIEILYLMK